MVYAGHPLVRRPHPDSARIAAWSASIGLYLAALLLLLRPVAPQIAEAIRHPTVPTVHWIEPQVLPAPPPPVVIPKPKPQVVIPRTKVEPKPLAPPVATPPIETNEGSQPATDAPPAPPATQAPSSTPVETTLAYLKAPLTFPREALQRRLSGTVLLRVLVDENGKPMQVEIEKSSGQRVLDQSALAQVRSNWQFQPAVVQGQRVKAWARVPVTFTLNAF